MIPRASDSEQIQCQRQIEGEAARHAARQIVIKDGLLVGAIWMGTKKGVGEISRLVSMNKNVEAFKHDLLDEAVDLTGM